MFTFQVGLKTHLNNSKYSTCCHTKNEDQKESSVEAMMPSGIENREKDETASADKGAEHSKGTKSTLSLTHVWN
jgi:hypothetical protein